MANLKRKIEILRDVALANIFKIRVKYDLIIRHRINVSKNIESSIVVSLTSYGQRLRHSVEYSIYSLLKQKLRPAKIIVWCDKGDVTPDKLPKSYILLKQYGVEFKEYAPKIRSYKKLIPTLKEFPDYHHIIVDDDIYYSPDLIKELYMAHQQDPEAIVAHAVTVPLFDETGKEILPYRQWAQYIGKANAPQGYNRMTIVPLGYGGIFYPKNAFDKEVENEEVFCNLCPLADDLWFYVHSIRLGINKIKVANSKVRIFPVDLLRQYISRDRLTATNRKKNENDTQLENLLNHYGLKI